MKHNFKYNRKAFTLVELLIVIAIIGILFVVLVSKVDFATDKAKTTGVQTDFRSFQVAFETVSRENAGFNTLGWDLGDANGDRVRNSYDKGDVNQNGICEDGETWVGQKEYTEIWTGVYTFDNPADANDMSAYLALEKAINKNLDPALQISIDPENKTIYMANGYQDPWKTEYHGFYLTNAHRDSKDRGAIVMYSDGPNKVFGSEQTITGGVVNIIVPGNNINGADDMAIISCYSYINGYGESTISTQGFLSDNKTQVSVSVEYAAMIGENGYSTLELALRSVKAEETIILNKDTSVDNIVIPTGTTLDLNGYTLTANNVDIEDEYSFIVDNSPELTGFLKIGRDNLKTAYYNPSVPFFLNDGYKFAKVKMQITEGAIEERNGKAAWVFEMRPVLGVEGNFKMFRSDFSDGIADNNLKIRVYVFCTKTDGTSGWDYLEFRDDLIAPVYTNSKSLVSILYIEDKFISFEPVVTFCSGTGAVYQYTSPTLDWFRE